MGGPLPASPVDDAKRPTGASHQTWANTSQGRGSNSPPVRVLCERGELEGGEGAARMARMEAWVKRAMPISPAVSQRLRRVGRGEHRLTRQGDYLLTRSITATEKAIKMSPPHTIQWTLPAAIIAAAKSRPIAKTVPITSVSGPCRLLLKLDSM